MDNISHKDTPEVMQQSTPAMPQQPELPPKRKLNWKGFSIGIIIVIIIEIIAFNALKSENKQITTEHPTPIAAKTQIAPNITFTTATPSKKTCTSTGTSAQGRKTYSYSDDTYCFSFTYPASWKTDTNE